MIKTKFKKEDFIQNHRSHDPSLLISNKEWEEIIQLKNSLEKPYIYHLNLKTENILLSEIKYHYMHPISCLKALLDSNKFNENLFFKIRDRCDALFNREI